MSLNKIFLKQMQTLLLNNKDHLETDLADFTIKQGKSDVTVFPEYGDHSGENASEVASYDNNLSVKNTLEKELKDTNQALQRIKKNTYGVCKYCHKDISQGRLSIRPASSACIKCKNKLLGKV